MDFNTIKSFAKKATEKTADGLSSMNEMRKNAAQETKISFGTTTIRKTIDGLYYIGFYSETPELFEFENFQFEGSTIIERTKKIQPLSPLKKKSPDALYYTCEISKQTTSRQLKPRSPTLKQKISNCFLSKKKNPRASPKEKHD